MIIAARTLAGFAALALFVSAPLPATAGSGRVAPDPAYGAGGAAVADFVGPTDEAGEALALFDTGAIVVAGRTHSPGGVRLAVAKFTPDGDRDSSFGDGGVATLPEADGVFSSANAVLARADGSVVVGGDANTNGLELPSTRPLLVRLLADGSPDPAFGERGSTGPALGQSQGAFIVALAALDDGRFLAAGRGGFDNQYSGFVARFDAGGRLDPAFGDRGVRVIDGPGNPLDVTAIAVGPGGRIGVLGSVPSGAARTSIGVLMLTPDGATDATFGDAGRAAVGLAGATTLCDSIAFQSGGRVVVLGHTAPPQSRAVLGRLTPDGRADATFGQGGVTIAETPVAFVARHLLVLGGDRLLASGAAFRTPGESDAAALALLPDGAPDASFGEAGFATVDVDGGNDSAAAAAVDRSGGIILGGTAAAAAGDELAAIRLSRAGQKTETFGDLGVATAGLEHSGDDAAAAAAPGPGGTLVVAGRAQTGGAYTTPYGIARFTSGGSPDPSFGAGGRIVGRFAPHTSSQVSDVAVDPQGRVYVAGSRDAVDHVLGAVARHRADGSPDVAFGTRGVADLGPLGARTSDVAVALLPDGRLAAAFWNGSERSVRVVALAESGAPDPRFGAGGFADIAVGGPYGAVLGLDLIAGGRLAVSGRVGEEAAPDLFAAVLTPDGAPDEAYGSGGVAVARFAGALVEASASAAGPDGRVAFAVSARAGARYLRAGVALFGPEGALDGAFGHGGVATVPRATAIALSAVAFDSAGRVLATGVSLAGRRGRAVLLGFDPDGSPDRAFGRRAVALPVPAGYAGVSGAEIVPVPGRVLVAGTASRVDRIADFYAASFLTGE